MTWIDFIDEGDESVMEFAGWLESLTPPVQLDLIARMDALEDLAAQGAIDVPQQGQPHDLDAIRRDPDLYELRWTLLTKVVRQYHAEPPRYPDHLVRLHLHIKGDTVRRVPNNQDHEISKAIVRYHAGESHDWGL